MSRHSSTTGVHNQHAVLPSHPPISLPRSVEALTTASSQHAEDEHLKSGREESFSSGLINNTTEGLSMWNNNSGTIQQSRIGLFETPALQPESPRQQSHQYSEGCVWARSRSVKSVASPRADMAKNNRSLKMTTFPSAPSPMSTTSMELPASFLRARLQALNQRKMKQRNNSTSELSKMPFANEEQQYEMPHRQSSFQSLGSGINGSSSDETGKPPKLNNAQWVPSTCATPSDVNRNSIFDKPTEKSQPPNASFSANSPLNILPTDNRYDPKMSETKPRWADSTVEQSAKKKLGDLQNKIVKFEAQLQVESQQRRAAEEKRLQLLAESVCELEKTLQAEIRRRLESNKAIQVGFESQLASLETHFERSLAEKSSEVAAATAALAARVQDAERDVSSLQQAETKQTDSLRNEVQQVVAEINGQIEGELKARKQRESAMFDKVSDMQKQIESRIAMERAMRHKEVDSLKASLEDINQNHVGLDQSLERQLTVAFSELRNALEAETEAREQSDSDIVQALNQYTIALQGALRIANAA